MSSVPTTRELNVATISVVTLASALLLISIVYTTRAGYEYFRERDVQRKWAEGADQTYSQTGLRMDNTDLAKILQGQDALLQSGAEGRLPIDDAMRQIADRY